MLNQKGLAQILLLGLIAAVIIAAMSFSYVKFIKKDSGKGEVKEKVTVTAVGYDNADIKTSCKKNIDCKLVDSERNYQACCLPGLAMCSDYSADNWVAVNKKSFNDFANKVGFDTCDLSKCEIDSGVTCPANENIRYAAVCVDNKCIKEYKSEVAISNTNTSLITNTTNGTNANLTISTLGSNTNTSFVDYDYHYFQDFINAEDNIQTNANWKTGFPGMIIKYGYDLSVIYDKILVPKYTRSGHSQIHDIECNEQYCLLAVGRPLEVYRLVKYDLTNGAFTDLSEIIPDFVEGYPLDFEWNGTYFIVSYFHKIYRYDGTNFEKTHDINKEKICSKAPKMKRIQNNQEDYTLFISGDCGQDKNEKIYIGKIAADGTISYTESNTEFDNWLTITKIAYNGEKALLVGFDSVLEYDGTNLINVSNKFSKYKGIYPAGVVARGSTWWVAWKTNEEKKQLCTYDGEDVISLNNTLVGFEDMSVGYMDGNDQDLYITGDYSSSSLNYIDENGNVTDLSWAMPTRIYSVYYKDGKIYLGAYGQAFSTDNKPVLQEQYAQQLDVTPESEDNIEKAMLSSEYYIDSNELVTFYLSNNKGENWEQVIPGEEIEFDKKGNSLSWKFTLWTNGNGYPSVRNITIDYSTE